MGFAWSALLHCSYAFLSFFLSFFYFFSHVLSKDLEPSVSYEGLDVEKHLVSLVFAWSAFICST